MLNEQLDEVNFLLRLSIHGGIAAGTQPWQTTSQTQYENIWHG